MPKAFTIDSEWEITRRLAVLTTVHKLMQEGQSQNIACQLAQIKPATYVRWRAAFAAGGRDALRPGVSSGRKPLAAMSEAELLEAKRIYVKTNRARGKGSKTTALRRFAKSPKCSPEVREAILKERSSKHTQTRSLRRQLDVIEGVIDYHRSPNKLTLAMAQNTGTMRMKYEADSHGNINLRRLRAGAVSYTHL